MNVELPGPSILGIWAAYLGEVVQAFSLYCLFCCFLPPFSSVEQKRRSTHFRPIISVSTWGTHFVLTSYIFFYYLSLARCYSIHQPFTCQPLLPRNSTSTRHPCYILYNHICWEPPLLPRVLTLPTRHPSSATASAKYHSYWLLKD